MVKTTSPLLKAKEKYFMVFFLAMACAAALFIPYIIYDQGYFLFYGDFNVQQVPFYQLAHDAIRSGNINWSFKTDLGTNFIGSYTFYLLGSPFFWLTLPFPSNFVPHLIGPLLILKFSCAALTSYAFLTRFVKNKNFAVIGGLLYAFSGFSVYNIFFNHFHEAIIYLPLLLLSLELLMVENRRGVFAFVVFLCALSNYYFFFGMVIFTVIYFILRCFSGQWKITFKKFLIVAFEALIGFVMSAVLLLPSIIMITQNSRVSSFLTGWSGLLYTKYQRYGYIFQCFFFPPDLPARPVFFDDADAKWSSVAGWLPVFSMTGVVAYLNTNKSTWLKRIIVTCIVIAFIPILNSSFSAFNYAYYARWFYMPVLMMVLATVVSLEDKKVDWRKAWIWTFGITLAITLAIGFFPKGQYSDKSFSGFGLFTSGYADRFWITCAIALGSLVILGLLLVLRKQSVRIFTTATILVVCFVSVVYSSYFVGTGKQSSYDTNDFIIPCLLKGADTITLEGQQASEIDDSRIDVYNGMDNTTMFFGMSGIQAFHSVVSSSINDYYDFIGVERVVGSRPDADENNYPLRSFLSVKYLFDYTGDSNNFMNENKIPKMIGWSYLNTQDEYDVYTNNCYIPYGFTYDYYVTKKYCDSLTTTQRQFMMLKAMVLSDDLIAKYDGILTDIEKSAGVKTTTGEKAVVSESAVENVSSNSSDTALSSENQSTSSETSVITSDSSIQNAASDSSVTSDNTSSIDVSSLTESSDQSSTDEETVEYNKYNFVTTPYIYKQDCKARAATSALTFETDNKGFTAVTKLSKDNLVFFSIPYDKGWSATVDGVPVKIEKVNVGFMAVLVSGDGEAHTIRFEYTTPGLKTGLIASGSATSVLVVYLITGAVIKRRRRKKYGNNQPELDDNDLVFKLTDFAGQVDDQEGTAPPEGFDGKFHISPTPANPNSQVQTPPIVDYPDTNGSQNNNEPAEPPFIHPTSYLDEFNKPQKSHFVRPAPQEKPKDTQNDDPNNKDAES